MIDRDTKWEDSGFDCPHCGGVLYKRKGGQPSKQTAVFYQCKQCGEERDVKGRLVRSGGGIPQPPRSFTIPMVGRIPAKVVWIVGGIFLLLLLLRFMSFAILRLLIPVALVVVVGVLIVRLGRDKDWW